MTLKEKILALLDAYYPEDESVKVIQRDLMRRGKVDNKKIIEILFTMIDHIDELAMTKNKK